MASTRTYLVLMVASWLCLLACVHAVSIDVLPMRIDNPKPDGSGVVFITLKTDPFDIVDSPALDHFTIVTQTFLAGQELKLWDAVNNNCNGAVLGTGDSVPADGKVCFWSDTSSVAEFENSFTYAAVDGTPETGTAQTVTIVNYDVQTCPSIPDLGESGFSTAPPMPQVSISLNGLEIQFEVTTAYVRNQTAWMIDFFDFTATAGGDSADGTGRTCSNHADTTFSTIDFSQWWYSQPRANFDDSIDASIENALNDVAFPMYDATSTKWTVTNVGCDKVKYTATIPTANIISNGADDCKRPGSTTPAASANGLDYTANLYVMALRPKNLTNSASGYYKSSFVFPFSFQLQQEVSNIETTSSGWAFQLAIEGLTATQGANLVLNLETTISAPGVDSPDLTLPLLTAMPESALRVGANAPVITRGTSSNCNTATTAPCVIAWQIVLPELTMADLGNSIYAYNEQYIGQYTLNWTTTGGDVIVANLIIDAVAANSTDLGQLDVPSSIDFFRTEATMYQTGVSGMAVPTFTSGEQVWVRHTFEVDASDVAAYDFELKTAWVCWSSVQDFTPTITGSGTGCTADIPGVMEAALGQRIMLYNISSGGIADEVYAEGSTRKSKVWGWTQVEATDANWAGGRTVQNGFGINALPLVTDTAIHAYYFHLISTVSQAPLPGRRDVHQMWSRDVVVGSSGSSVEGITIYSDDDDAPSSASRSAFSWLSLFM